MVWEKFFDKFRRKFLIGRDFNGHHHLWGNWKNCATGSNLFHCITDLETNITLLHDGSQTYISDTTGSLTALDLTFVNQRSALLYTWMVETDPWNSDHFAIFIKYNGIIGPRKGSKNACRLHNNYNDWTTFMGRVKESILEVKTRNRWNRERDVKEKYDNFMKIIKGKLEENSPKRKNKNSIRNGGQGIV